MHTIAGGQQDQYGTYSGWDIYHSLSQLQAMLDPSAAGDQAQSLLNYYEQDKILQQWGYLNLNNYVMVGDPAQSIIADYYAFGAHNFDTAAALHDMLTQATTTNDVRPARTWRTARLPARGRQLPQLLQPARLRLVAARVQHRGSGAVRFAAALGDSSDATMLEQRANNWQNVFNPANKLLNPRNSDGSWVPGITPTTTDHYVEGDANEYLWNVPNDYAALFALLGGPDKAAAALRKFLSQPNGFGKYAQLTNEFGFGEQYALDYAGDPAGTQQIVNYIRNTMYQPGPSLDNNDDLGANSSTFIWEMLGMYPENSGSGNLVFNSPGSRTRRSPCRAARGSRSTHRAPRRTYYVKSLKINGQPYDKLYVPYSTLADGATLDWTLGTRPTSWGTAAEDAPPSYTAGMRRSIGYLAHAGDGRARRHRDRHGRGGEHDRPAAAACERARGRAVRADRHHGRSAGRSTCRRTGAARCDLTVDADATTKQTFYTVPISLSTATRRATCPGSS